MPRLLLLGGTREALDLAEATSNNAHLHTITSLAGRTRAPARIPGELRIGGFGGPEGLADYLVSQAIDLLVDATHPFAETMARNAEQACRLSNVPRLKLLRPAWEKDANDRWIEVDSTEQAAATLPGLATRVFLTVGQRDLVAFSRYPEIWFLIRLIDPPADPLPLARHELILGRGPFAEADEVTLLREHRIEALVAKNSGGALTHAKIGAARRLGLPVVMRRRPDPPPGETVETVDQALAWIVAQAAERR